MDLIWRFKSIMVYVGAGMIAASLFIMLGLLANPDAMTGGIVDARFIALADTALESPLGQIAIIPMLAWIANSAPGHLKATFFAVMASFTNLALSASQLCTKYLNQIFTVTREVKDRGIETITTPADYSELGWLMLSAMMLGFVVPIAAVLLIKYSRLKSA